MRPPKILLESAGLPSSYKRVSQHAFIECVNLTFRGKQALKVDADGSIVTEFSILHFQTGIQGSERRELRS